MKKTTYDGQLMTETIFECSCHDFSHTFKIEIMKTATDGDEEFFVEVGLNRSLGFFARIWLSLKYIFTGNSSIWDRVLQKKDMIQLQKQLEAHFGKKSNRKVRK